MFILINSYGCTIIKIEHITEVARIRTIRLKGQIPCHTQDATRQGITRPTRKVLHREFQCCVIHDIECRSVIGLVGCKGCFLPLTIGHRVRTFCHHNACCHRRIHRRTEGQCNAILACALQLENAREVAQFSQGDCRFTAKGEVACCCIKAQGARTFKDAADCRRCCNREGCALANLHAIACGPSLVCGNLSRTCNHKLTSFAEAWVGVYRTHEHLVRVLIHIQCTSKFRDVNKDECMTITRRIVNGERSVTNQLIEGVNLTLRTIADIVCTRQLQGRIEIISIRRTREVELIRIRRTHVVEFHCRSSVTVIVRVEVVQVRNALERHRTRPSGLIQARRRCRHHAIAQQDACARNLARTDRQGCRVLNRKRDIFLNGKALIGRPGLTRGNLSVTSDHNLTIFNVCSTAHHNARLVCTDRDSTFKFGNIFKDEGVWQVLIVREGTRAREFLEDIGIIRVTIVIGKRAVQFNRHFANTVILQVARKRAIKNELRIGVTQSFKRSILVIERHRACDDHASSPSIRSQGSGNCLRQEGIATQRTSALVGAAGGECFHACQDEGCARLNRGVTRVGIRTREGRVARSHR